MKYGGKFLSKKYYYILLQALNWLLRMVNHAMCIHDLLWFFVSALAPQEEEIEGDNPDDAKDAQKNEGAVAPAVKDKKEQKKEQEVKTFKCSVYY